MRLRRLVPVVSVMLLLFSLSSLPASAVPIPGHIGFDKIVHAAAYGVLACSFLFAIPDELRQNRPCRVALLTIIFCVLYGISDEIHQSFVPGREPSGFDVAADAIGAAVVVMAAEKKRRAGRNSLSCESARSISLLPP